MSHPCCPHCGAPVLSPTATYCCHGCEAAAQLLADLGLDDWYATRESAAPRPTPLDPAWANHPVVDLGDSHCATLQVDGLRCGSCTWVVEQVLARTDGVVSAHVSYASGRTRITWDPAQTSLPDLVQRVAKLGYVPRPTTAARGLDPLFAPLGVALVCTANLMLMSAGLYASWLDGIAAHHGALLRWVGLALATPIALYAASPFLQGAWNGLRRGRIGMDVPIALAVLTLYGHGIVQTLRAAEGYLDSLGMLVSLLLVGRLLDARGRRMSAEAAADVAAQLPQTCRRRTDTGVEDVAPDQLVPGDILELGPGTEIGADATVIEGGLTVQTALLTGESEPRRVGAGDGIYAGTVVVSGTGAARAEAVGSATVALSMAARIEDAIDKPSVPNPADALAPLFTLATIGIAGITGLVWGVYSGVDAGIETAVAVLVVACPCALGLAVPLAVSSGLGALARRGVVLRDGDALMRLAQVEAVALDKTGTLTLGEPVVTEAADSVLQDAAGLERGSQHPIGRAIVAAALERGLPLPLPQGITETPGVGIEGTLDGVHLSLTSAGPGAVQLRQDGAKRGVIRLADQLRPTARALFARLAAQGLPVAVLSGDHQHAVTQLTGPLGGVAQLGNQLPEDKVAWVMSQRTLFVGDGLNDGPALAQSHVGLAVHTGAGSSLQAADGVLLGGDLSAIPVALTAAQVTQQTVTQNLRRALLYNAIAVTAAAAGLVNPLVAAILMPLSSGVIVVSSLRLDRRIDRALQATPATTPSPLPETPPIQGARPPMPTVP